VVLLSGDLMLASAAQGAVDKNGFQLIVAPTSASALTACSDNAIAIVVVDLRTTGLDLESLIRELRTTGDAPIHVMACGPHVHEATLARAAAAGCDEIVTRGEFDRRLDATLARLTSGTS
jgi:DNA-binding response OmpR family regulator